MSQINQTLNPEKQELRQQILALTRQLGYANRIKKDQLILNKLQELTEINVANHVFCFISVRTEPDTHQLIDWLLAEGKRVSIPKIMGPGTINAVEFPGWSRLHAGQFGIPQPEASTDVSAEVDICLTPGVCFDLKGNRLGYGAGYYDRWLDRHAVRQIIAPAYDCQVLDSIPANQLDKKVGLIVTDTRVINP